MERNDSDYGRMAVELELHIGDFQPDSWREPVKSVFSRIFVSPDDVRKYDEANRHGLLGDVIGENEKFAKYPVLAAAVNSFFETRQPNL